MKGKVIALERKNDEKLLKICLTAMFAALICVSTIMIQIPSPLGGYINLGDAFIIVSAVVLGPLGSFGAGAVGSALADLITGYAVYAPATFLIKGTMGIIAALIYHSLSVKEGTLKKAATVLCAIPAELIMIVGYYFYAAIALGTGFIPALQTVAGNSVQGLAGIVGGALITLALKKTGVLGKVKT